MKNFVSYVEGTQVLAHKLSENKYAFCLKITSHQVLMCKMKNNGQLYNECTMQE